MTFKQFLSENLWGKIPMQGKKPSDGIGGESMSSNKPSGGSMPVSPMGKMMMKKKMGKN